MSLEAKLGIIHYLKKGESQSSLASKKGIKKLTVGDFKKNEKKKQQQQLESTATSVLYC